MKQIKHTIGGEERTLDFGKMYYLKFAGDFYGGDPLVMTAESMTDPAKQFKFCSSLVFAGVNCYNQVNKLPLISKEDAEHFVGMMDEGEAALLIKKYADLQGEVQAQTESPSHGTN